MAKKESPKGKVQLRVDESDLMDIKYLVKNRTHFDTSDFIRQAIKNELVDNPRTPETSVKRIALDQLKMELENIAGYFDSRAFTDPNKLFLVEICSKLSTFHTKNLHKDSKDVVIRDTSVALMHIWEAYPSYYFELKAFIASCVHKKIYSQLFAN